MKKIILIVLFTFFFISNYAQDTIFAYPYPNGIITNNLDYSKHSSKFKFNPINNPNIEVKLRRSEIKMIAFASGEKFENIYYNPKNFNYQVFQINSETGKFIYTDIVEFKGINKLELYNSLKLLPNSEIKYNLKSEDNINQSFKRYSCNFLTFFAGDPYEITFNLLIRFKDGAIKYKYSDFIGTFIKEKVKNSSFEGFEDGNRVSTKVIKDLSKAYGRGERFSDNKKFWIIINRV